MKKYIKNTIVSLLILVIMVFILTLFNYFYLINDKIVHIMLLITPLIIISINSYLLGKATNSRGYIEGIKYSLMWIVLLLLSSLITNNFIIYNLIYYLIILIISVISSIIGINTKKN